MSAALLRTPLYDAHVAAGARLVDFGGWEMPLHYGSQIQEHHAVRQDKGMFDVSHMRSVDIAGPGSRDFLRHLLANDVNKLKQPGRALYSCMLNEAGGIIDDLIAYYFADDSWRVVVNAACAENDIAWMQQVAQTGGFDVSITPRMDLGMLAVQGPDAMACLQTVRPGWAEIAQVKPFTALVFGQTVVARTGYTGEDGVEVMLPAQEIVDLWQDLLAAGVKPCGLGARDTLRLEAGMNLYGQDMDAATQPAQAGLNWTVALSDEARDFVGRKAITAPDSPTGQMLGLKLLERGVMRAHMAVQTPKGTGEITSGTMSPTLGVSIAMARLPDGVLPGDDVQVDIRGKSVSAKVCPLPFVRHGKAVNE